MDHPPFSGEIADGYLWGRGAIDMKHMVAMTLAVARQLKRQGTVPARDLIFAFLADEEAGGFQGSHWLVQHRRELFEGASEAISEVGGFSVTLADDVRAYLIETAEKGIMWLRLRAQGTPGHASMLQPDNAVAKLAAAVTRLDQHIFPQIITPPVREFLDGVTAITGQPFPEDNLQDAVGRLGGIARIIGATLRDTANVTIFNAGYKANVVPSAATAEIDVRVLPGRQEELVRGLRRDHRPRHTNAVGARAPTHPDHLRRSPRRPHDSRHPSRGSHSPHPAVHALRRHRRQGL